MEESNFNFKCVWLWDLDIPKEKWLNYLQTVETMIRCPYLDLQCLPFTLLGVSRLQWVKSITLWICKHRFLIVCFRLAQIVNVHKYWLRSVQEVLISQISSYPSLKIEKWNTIFTLSVHTDHRLKKDSCKFSGQRMCTILVNRLED